MEDDPRPFKAINIDLIGVQTGRERFTHGDMYNPPSVALWRNNLTALSQRLNLYFVATRDAIAVYKPEFPFQKLHRLPSLLIPPTLANPAAEGYIDTCCPHAINHLIVGDLGSEEIVLVATDSGNVTAYYTKSIEEAIRKHPYRFSTDARSDYVGVRAFFTQWVHESAWGLSIHSRGRMIAVSANTPNRVSSDDPCAKITVFAFALTQDRVREQGQDEHIGLSEHARQADWLDWNIRGARSAPPSRDKNYKITLGGVEGHDDNIPSISFVNSEEDPDGKWLLSTDIGGELKIWQIWRGICQKSWYFAEKRMRAGFNNRRREGGWLVATLDPCAFRTARTMEQFCGNFRAPQYHGHAGESYDITHVVRLHTPGNSHVHPTMYENTEEEDNDEEDQEALDSWSDLEDAIIEFDQMQTIPISLREDFQYPTETSSTRFWRRFESDDEDFELAAEVHNTIVPTQSTPATDNDTIPPQNPEVEAALLEDVHLVDMALDESEPDHAEYEDEEINYGSSSEDAEDDLSITSHRSATSLLSLAHRRSQDIDVDSLSASDSDFAFHRKQWFEGKLSSQTLDDRAWNIYRDHANTVLPSIPTLHCSVSNLRLLLAPEADSPHIFCANILKQALPPVIDLSANAMHERLNMIQQIPELGVVIIATQIGRCAVCTMTRNEATDTVGLRVDWILPTRKQELKNLRPLSPLLGIATSPIQGRFQQPQFVSSRRADSTNQWGSDGIVDGVSTTFDPNVLVFQENNNEESSETEDAGRGNSADEHKMKRKRLSYDVSPPSSSKPKTERRKWQVPKGPESWQAMESSRRHRLMLTYMDMTVLTYEISRGVDMDDIELEENDLELLD